MQLSRRGFLKFGALATIGAGATIGASLTTSDVEYRNLKIPIGNLPASFNNYRVGFLSDIHLGSALPSEMLRDAISFFQNQQIDLMILGGDYIWTRSSEMTKLFPIIRNQKYANVPEKELPGLVYPDLADIVSSYQPKDGIVGVLGNHDGWTAPIDCRQAFAAKNISLLVNESLNINRGNESLILYGCADYWTGIPKLPWKIDPVLNKQSLIFICHNPDFISTSLNYPLKYSLALAGHTHGGQINLPILGAPFYNIHDLRFTQGLIELAGKKIFVSRGLGVVEIPYRVNCRPEVSVIELVRT